MYFFIGIVVLVALYSWIGFAGIAVVIVGIAILFGLTLSICWISNGIDHRKNSRKKGGFEGSIWEHIKLDAKETEAVLRSKKENVQPVTEHINTGSSYLTDMPKGEIGARRSLSDCMAQKIESVDNTAYALADLLEIDKPKEALAQGALPKGISFTGVGGDKLDELLLIAEALGWKFQAKISKKVGLLVVGANPGTKLGLAKCAGIPVISEEDFFCRYAKYGPIAENICINKVAAVKPLAQKIPVQAPDDRVINRFKLPDQITFLYENAEGETAYRDVAAHAVDSNDYGHNYIKAFCLTSSANKTFRTDRIIGMITRLATGEMLPVDAWLAQISGGKSVRYSQPPSIAVVKENIEKQTSILFTGFKKSERDEMEAMAKEAGWLVRKTVSAKLDYLMAGGNAGPSKIREAEALGVEMVPIIDEKYFRDWLEAEVEAN